MPTERKMLLALFAIALGIRVLYLAATSGHTDPDAQTATRDFAYAREIASGFRWVVEPVSSRAPGYPLVLAALYFFSAKQIWIVTFLQAALGALAVVVVYRMGRLLLAVPLATVAALWFAFHARHIHSSGVLQRDVLSVLLFLLVVFLVAKPFTRMRSTALSALAYAALVHVDPQFLLLLPLFAFFVALRTRHRLLNLQNAFVFVGIALVACVPWAIRNYAVYDQAIPVGLEARRFLRPVGLAPADRPKIGLAVEAPREVLPEARSIRRNAVEFWRFARLQGTAGSGTHDSPTPAPRREEPAWSPLHNAAGVVNIGIALPFFLVGIARALRARHRTALVLAATVAAYFLVRLCFGGSEQARFPVDALVVVLAFYGLAGIFELLGRKDACREAHTPPERSASCD